MIARTTEAKRIPGLARIPRDRDLVTLGDGELPAYFTKEEVERVLGEVEGRDRLFLSLLWQTGLRVSEALALTCQDVDFYSKTLKVKSLKKQRPEVRTIPFNGSLSGILGSYIAQKGLRGRDRLFPITRQRAFQVVGEACSKAGIERDRSHPHTFRHSFAIHCVLSGAPLPVLKKWLGHSSISRTMIYCQVLARDTRAFYEAINF
ncbi:MAG: tyrosine-type recombinase/integrase [Deltaproteobacteria bacterium]|nr:tyrosine-type recombinase/integrase [Deltaproteobacteria bacterium]